MDNEIQRLLDLAANDKNHSSVSFAERVFPGDETAKTAFSALKEKARNVNVWNKVAALNSFKLYNEDGSEQTSPIISENLLMRLSLKGSGKYDWVKIERIVENENLIFITVKPTSNPTDEDADKARTSHFFTAESNNNFCLLKDADKVSFYVIGLNEKQNTSEAKNTLEVIRNVATANIGSYLGIQKAEWETFCSNFLDLYNLDEV